MFILNNRLLFSLFFVIVLFFSLSAIHAADVNTTDNPVMNFDNGINLQIENEMQPADVGSQNIMSNGSDCSLTAVSKNQTGLSSQTNNVYYQGDYSLTLTDMNSNMPLANKSITFSLNNVKYTNVTDSKGVVSLNLNLNPGKYSVTAYFSGDSTFESARSASTVQVLPTIKAKQHIKILQGKHQIQCNIL